jgi:hypothetical protein
MITRYELQVLIESSIKELKFEKYFPLIIQGFLKRETADLNILLGEFLKMYSNDLNFLNGYDFEIEDGELYVDVDDIDEKTWKKIILSNEFKEFIFNKFNNSNLNEIINRIDENGNLVIYRTISVSKNWVEQLPTKVKSLGIFWSWDEGYPVYNNKKDYLIELIAIINEKHINWQQTILQDFYYGGGENEITLFKNTPIKLIKIKTLSGPNNNLDINKKFYINKIYQT